MTRSVLVGLLIACSAPPAVGENDGGTGGGDVNGGSGGGAGGGLGGSGGGSAAAGGGTAGAGGASGGSAGGAELSCPSDVAHQTLAVATVVEGATQMIHVGSNVGLLWEHPYGDGGADLETAIIDPSGNVLVGPTPVTPNDGRANGNGRLARGDGGFIVVYEEFSAPGPKLVRFAFLADNLRLVPGSAQTFPGATGAVQSMPDVDWDPVNQQWGLYWQEDVATMFARMTSSGAPLGSPVQLAPEASWVGTRSVSNNVQWTGSEHAVLHADLAPDGGSMLALSLVNPAGTVTATNTIAEGPYVFHQVFGWNGSEFAVMWSQGLSNTTVHFIRVHPDGTPIPGTYRTISNASAGRAGEATLTWNGNEWILAWTEANNGNVELWTIRMAPSSRRQLRCTSAVPMSPALLSFGTSNLLTHVNGSAIGGSPIGVGSTELLTLP